MKEARLKSPIWFSAFEWLLALRYLKARKRKRMPSVFAGFSLLGVMVGVATLITVMSVMNGFRRDILEKLGSAEGHITVYSGDGPLNDYAEVSRQILTIPGVKLAFPLVRGQAFASAGEFDSGAMIIGVHKEDIEKRIANKTLNLRD